MAAAPVCVRLSYIADQVFGTAQLRAAADVLWVVLLVGSTTAVPVLYVFCFGNGPVRLGRCFVCWASAVHSDASGVDLLLRGGPRGRWLALMLPCTWQCLPHCWL